MEIDRISAKVEKKFLKLFNAKPALFMAPGRINLIGEHTDYNDGFVLPAAIDKSIVFALHPNNKKLFRFFSIDFNAYFETSSIDVGDNNNSWSKYLLGVLAQFRHKGIKTQGFDCVFGGNIPIGSGLSSSAAIECGLALGLNEIYNTQLSPYELVTMSQKAEHEYAGVMCGIMDQFSSIFGKKDHVFKLDCRDHSYHYYQLDQQDHILVLCDTKVKHQLALSEYNVRRAACEKGVEILRQIEPSIKALRDIKPDQVKYHEELFDPVTFQRCLYVAEENERVIQACEHLQKGELYQFGGLMYKSHEGLKNKYQVSCNELDLLVDATKDMEFVLGSRLMGGGFGGCTINLLNRFDLDRFINAITSVYHNTMKKELEIYLVDICDGAKALN